MNPEVSPRGRIPDRIVTLAWPRTRFDIEIDGWARKRDMERIGGARRKYKEIFYSRLFDSDTKDFKAYDGTVRDASSATTKKKGKNRSRVDELRRRLANLSLRTKTVVLFEYSSTIFTKIRDKTRTGTRTTCTTFSKLDTELPRDLTSLNDRPCRFSFFFLKLHAFRSNTAGIQGPTRCMGGKSRRGKV